MYNGVNLTWTLQQSSPFDSPAAENAKNSTYLNQQPTD